MNAMRPLECPQAINRLRLRAASGESARRVRARAHRRTHAIGVVQFSTDATGSFFERPSHVARECE